VPDNFPLGLAVALKKQGVKAVPSPSLFPERAVKTPGEVAAMQSLVLGVLPAAAGRCLRSAVCLYTNTLDGDFLIDHHPASDRVVLASPCSGFGFKFASAVGEALSQLALDGRAGQDLAPFGLARLRNSDSKAG